jgi:dienelactone hydrolase
MKNTLILALAAGLAFSAPAFAQTRVAPVALTPAAPLPSGVSLKETRFFSEQVEVSGRLFTPAGSGKHAAVVLAPAWGQTAASLDAYAAALAGQGIVALTVDYRGWGRSGGFIYLNERVFTDDRQRFSLHTPQLVIRRGRLDPESQVQDIRNAITYLQGEANVDQAKIGVLGLDMAGGHVISVLGMDARAKAGVAVTPIIAGSGEPKKSHIPTAAEQAALIRLARTGKPPQTAAEGAARNAEESRLALMDYKPFWRIDAIPAADAVQFIVAGADEKADTAKNAAAAQKAIKGPTELKTLAGARHALTGAQTQEAAAAAAAFLKAKLG